MQKPIILFTASEDEFIFRKQTTDFNQWDKRQAQTLPLSTEMKSQYYCVGKVKAVK